MKSGILALLLSCISAAQCLKYIVDPKVDPFKKYYSQYKCNPNDAETHFVADPLYCDRFLACSKSRSAVMYCPRGWAYNPDDAQCIHSESGIGNFCASRGANNVITPEKPSAPCYNSPQHSEIGAFKLLKDGSYFKTSIYQNVYHYCKKGMNWAYTLECADPKYPEIILDSDSPIKCYPKGSLRQAMIRKTQSSLPSLKHAGFKPMAAVIYKHGLPIRFRHNRPLCPKIAAVKKHFEFNDASRFMHNSDCIHFWTCSTDNTPRSHSCPHAQVFDPATERCIYYKLAGELCNKVFDYESDEKLALYQRIYGLQQQVEDRQTMMTAEHRAQLMKASIAQLDAQKELLQTLKRGTPEFRSAAFKAIQAKNRLKVLQASDPNADKTQSRQKRSYNLYLTKTPDHLGRIHHDKEYDYHQIANVSIDDKGVLRCPPAQLMEGVSEEDVIAALKTPHFNAHQFYNMDSFRFGVATLYPMPDRCDKYYICGPWEHASQDNQPSIGGCSPGQAFQPLRIKPYNSLVQYAFVPNTGRCLDAEKVKGGQACIRGKPAPPKDKAKESGEMVSDPFAIIDVEDAKEKEVQAYMTRLMAEIEEEEKRQEEMTSDEPNNDEFLAEAEQDHDFSDFMAGLDDLTDSAKEDPPTFGSGGTEL